MSFSTVEFSPLLPWSVFIATVVVTLLVVGLGVVARARGAWLRVAAAMALLLILLRPSLVEEKREPLRDIAVVVIDETPSAEIGGREAEIERALAALRQRLGVYAGKLEVRELRLNHRSIADAGDGTKLIGPLVEAFGDVPPRRAAGAILLTDGQVHDMPDSIDRLPFGAPVHVLLAGTPDMRDRRLVVVNSPAYGIVGSEVTVTVRVEDTDPRPGTTARLQVRRDGQLIGERDIEVGPEQAVPVTLEHGGTSVVELSVDRGPDELMLENNRAVVSVNGVRDRLRVLLVSGEPHPGERTWRNLLKSDPSVDLVHFTILRPPEKQDGTPINELSLISFPTRELFEVKLDDFDLVIFDRYRRRGVLPPVYLQNIVDYVRKGGALLEAVGPSFASPFSIYRTPLGKVLPGEPTGQVIERPYRPRVTDLGQRHPVTANLPGSRVNAEPTWGRWIRQVDVEPTRGNILMSGAEAKPLLILDRYEKGRVAQFNSDHIWLWARGFEGGGPQAELLRRLAHWLMKEPDLEENDLRMSFDGDRLRIVRRSLEVPKSNEVTLTDPAGKERKVTLKEDSGGRSLAELPVTQAGLYRVNDGERVAMAAVGALNPKEFADLRSTPRILQPVVEKTGGGVAWLKDGLPDIRRVRAGRSAEGRGWIGLWQNDDYVVTGVTRLSLLPPLLALALAAGLLAAVWRREGD